MCVSSRNGRPLLVGPCTAVDAAGLYDLYLDLPGLLRLAPQRPLPAEDGQSTAAADWTTPMMSLDNFLFPAPVYRLSECCDPPAAVSHSGQLPV